MNDASDEQFRKQPRNWGENEFNQAPTHNGYNSTAFQGNPLQKLDERFESPQSQKYPKQGGEWRHNTQSSVPQQQMNNAFQPTKQGNQLSGYNYLQYVSRTDATRTQQQNDFFMKKESSSPDEFADPNKIEKASKVLLVTIQNPKDEVIQHKVIFSRFADFGPVEQILIFSKKQQWKFFVDMDSIESSSRAIAFLDSTLLNVNGNELKMRVQYSNQPVLHLKNGNPGGINYKELNGKFENTMLSYSLLPANSGGSGQNLPNPKNNQFGTVANPTSHSASLPYTHHRTRLNQNGSSHSPQQQTQQQVNQLQSAHRFQSANLVRETRIGLEKQKGNLCDDDQEEYLDDLLHLINKQPIEEPNQDEDEAEANSGDESSKNYSDQKSASSGYLPAHKAFDSGQIFPSAAYAPPANLSGTFQATTQGSFNFDTINKTVSTNIFAEKQLQQQHHHQQEGMLMLDKLLGQPIDGNESSEENEIMVSDDEESLSQGEQIKNTQYPQRGFSQDSQDRFTQAVSRPETFATQQISRFSNSLTINGQPQQAAKSNFSVQNTEQFSKSWGVKYDGAIPQEQRRTAEKNLSGNMNGPVVQENMGLFNGTTYVKQGFLEDSRPSKVIYVNHLTSSDIQMVHLYNLFSNFGDITKILLKRNKNAAFIEYTTQEYATRSKDFMDKKVFFENELRVFYSHFDSILQQDHEEEETTMGSAPRLKKQSQLEYFIGGPTTFRFAKETKMTLNSPSLVIHISNLKQEVCDHERMLQLFQPFGKIDAIHIEKVPPRYMCHIKFSSIKESIMAVANMHNFEIKGRKMFISFTRKKLDFAGSGNAAKNIVAYTSELQQQQQQLR